MRVAHSRHASVRPTANRVGRNGSARLTADKVGRNLHRSTAAGTSIQTTDTSVPDQSCRRQMRASRGTGWSDGRATVLSRHPIAQKRGCKVILKEPWARAA